MSTTVEFPSVRGLFAKAIQDEKSVRRSLMRVDWDVSNNCENSKTRTLFARPSTKPYASREVIVDRHKRPIPLQVELSVRCRKCRNCMKHRASVWSARAVLEYRMSYRTWLATFTFTPSEHDHIRHTIRHKLGNQNGDYDLLTEREQMGLRHNACSKFLTLWLKRIRKNSGAKLRYMMVMEAHKSGLPHYHALIHEPEHGESVTKVIMEKAWPHGFTNFKLLPEDESWRATYACKYLSKSSLARVRASRRYGSSDPALR